MIGNKVFFHVKTSILIYVVGFGSLSISVSLKPFNAWNNYFMLIFMNLYFIWVADDYSECFYLRLLLLLRLAKYWVCEPPSIGCDNMLLYQGYSTTQDVVINECEAMKEWWLTTACGTLSYPVYYVEFPWNVVLSSFLGNERKVFKP